MAVAPVTNVSSGELLMLNDEVVDMLQLLNYDSPGQFTNQETPPMSRSWFAEPANNSALQFKYFAQLCGWLLKRIGREAGWGKYDDPGTICTGICSAVKDIGLGDGVVPLKLKPGWGEAVLEVSLRLFIEAGLRQLLEKEACSNFSLKTLRCSTL